MLEIIEYRGFRLQVGPVGKGWRAFIYSPGSISALPDSPTNLEKSRKDGSRVEICTGVGLTVVDVAMTATLGAYR